jgi:hypothetical protein
MSTALYTGPSRPLPQLCYNCAICTDRLPICHLADTQGELGYHVTPHAPRMALIVVYTHYVSHLCITYACCPDTPLARAQAGE